MENDMAAKLIPGKVYIRSKTNGRVYEYEKNLAGMDGFEQFTAEEVPAPCPPPLDEDEGEEEEVEELDTPASESPASESPDGVAATAETTPVTPPAPPVPPKPAPPAPPKKPAPAAPVKGKGK